MTDYIIHGQTLTDIADAIRTKNPDVSGLIDPSDMKDDILDIPSGSTPYSPSLFKIVESLPATLTNEAIYLIPNGDQIYPDVNTVVTVPNPWPSLTNMKHVTVTCNYTPVSGDRITIDKLNTVTKFWLLDGETLMPKTRGSYPEDITYGSANRQTKPTYIYEYDTTNPLAGWVDISEEVTQADWEAGVLPSHIVNTVVFSNVDISRNTVGVSVYSAELYNLCNVYGKISQIGAVTTYDIYYVDNGVAVNKGYQKTILELYTMLINGQITPSPVSLMTSQEESIGENNESDE